MVIFLIKLVIPGRPISKSNFKLHNIHGQSWMPSKGKHSKYLAYENMIAGYINSSKIEEKTENSEVELTAIANVEIENKIYSSNQNRILYGYDSVSIVMTSENEGEEVKYGDEIDYEIIVTNTGKSNLQNEFVSSIGVRVIDFLPEEVEPVKIIYNNYSFIKKIKIYNITKYKNTPQNNKVITLYCLYVHYHTCISRILISK